MASRKKPGELGSLRLRDDWDPSKSAFQEDDGKPLSASGSGDDVDFDPVQARREQKMQALGREIVSTLYMLIRNTKIHAPDNAIFLKPIDTLREALNRVVASERMVN